MSVQTTTHTTRNHRGIFDDGEQFVLKNPITGRANGSIRFRLDQIAHPKQRIASIRLTQFLDGTVCLFLDFTEEWVFLSITAHGSHC